MAALIALWQLQWFVASFTKASRPDAVPGKIDDSLSHESFVFRAHRTFMNSLENLPAMFATAFLALLVGADPFWTGLLIWLFVAARVVHMALYYAIATERNPSPRSYFFMMGLAANLGLLAVAAATLI
ncbi:MAG: MAPEG family protein [Alteromonadaceae bacterium]|nr:MAPEG family protein [Alteromonadaceae bacterium]